MGNREVEEAACKRLEKFFRASGIDACCTVKEKGTDPPDIECRAGKSLWAVEVTRLFRQECQEGPLIASPEIDKPLLRFAKCLDKERQTQDEGSYVLNLQGPPAGKRYDTWQKEVRCRVRHWLQSNKGDELTFEGGSLSRTCNTGRRWSCGAGLRDDGGIQGVEISDISSNLNCSLDNVLKTKENKLEGIRKTKKYSKIILYIIDEYCNIFSEKKYEIDNDIKLYKNCTKSILSKKQNNIIDIIYIEYKNEIYEIYNKK